MLDLMSLLGGAVLSLPFEYIGDATGLTPDIISGRVKAQGEIKNYSGYVLLKAKINLEAKVVCARCNTNFDTNSAFSIEQKLTDKLENKDNDEYILIENGVFDEAEFIKDSLILELPSKFLCNEDCMGLCPRCGKNLNKSPCSCDTKDIDPRLEVLSKYFEE